MDCKLLPVVAVAGSRSSGSLPVGRFQWVQIQWIPSSGSLPVDPFQWIPSSGSLPVDPFQWIPFSGTFPVDPFQWIPSSGTFPVDPFQWVKKVKLILCRSSRDGSNLYQLQVPSGVPLCKPFMGIRGMQGSTLKLDSVHLP